METPLPWNKKHWNKGTTPHQFATRNDASPSSRGHFSTTFRATWSPQSRKRISGEPPTAFSCSFSVRNDLLWMDAILHPRNHGKPLFAGICRGIVIPGCLRWCRISSIHGRVLEMNSVSVPLSGVRTSPRGPVSASNLGQRLSAHLDWHENLKKARALVDLEITTLCWFE